MLLCFSLEITESCRLRHLTIPWVLPIGRNWPATGGHSRPHENFNFNQNYPARSVKSQIAYKKEMGGGGVGKIIGKAYFIVNARAGQFDDFGRCESYAKPDFISVRTRLPLYKGDVGVHYLKVVVRI